MIGIIGAMEEEIAELRVVMENVECSETASMTFYKGRLCGNDVVLVRSGIGKVNAAICAQTLVNKFNVTTLINTGIAGSLNAQIDIGDIVISKDSVHHDMNAEPFGYEAGQVPRMKTKYFAADPRLVELATAANQEVNPDTQTFIGRVATGDQFVASDEEKRRIVEQFHADCVEMEGAPIAHVAYLNNISYVIIRAISDKADNSATMDYPTFEKRAIEHSIRLVLDLMLRIRAEKADAAADKM